MGLSEWDIKGGDLVESDFKAPIENPASKAANDTVVGPS